MTRPQEINIHRQMTVRLAIVSLNSILSLALSPLLSSPLLSSRLLSSRLSPSNSEQIKLGRRHNGRVFNLDSEEDVQ